MVFAAAQSVGNFSTCGVVNNTGDRIYVVTKVLISNTDVAAHNYRLGMTTNPIQDATRRAASRDLRRLTVTAQAFNRLQAADQLASVNPIALAANTTLTFDVFWILARKGDALNLQTDIVNQVAGVVGWFWGYERALRPEEQILD